MDFVTLLRSKPVFKDQPISCPWISCQPYPSSQMIKNKHSELVKKRNLSVNNHSSKKSLEDHSAFNTYSSPTQQSSSTHFFYFLRLMQLFPDTHPATLHTVLTLSKNNFFFAIDKLLYAQKCKHDLGKKLSSIGGRGRGYNTSSCRGRFSGSKLNQRYHQMPRSVSTCDLAEVQRIIDFAQKSYIGVQPVENDQCSPEENQMSNQIVKICVDNADQLVHAGQTFVETENHEVIEIVCFDNEQTVLKQSKTEDDMDIETYDENVDTLEPTMDDSIEIAKIEEDSEPPVIVVGTMNDPEDTDCISEGHLVESHQLDPIDSDELPSIHVCEET